MDLLIALNDILEVIYDKIDDQEAKKSIADWSVISATKRFSWRDLTFKQLGMTHLDLKRTDLKDPMLCDSKNPKKKSQYYAHLAVEPIKYSKFIRGARQVAKLAPWRLPGGQIG